MDAVGAAFDGEVGPVVDKKCNVVFARQRYKLFGSIKNIIITRPAFRCFQPQLQAGDIAAGKRRGERTVKQIDCFDFWWRDQI
jgi:hypothetical protein